jgi:hypothetical protein
VSWKKLPKRADLTPKNETQTKKKQVRTPPKRTHQRATSNPKPDLVFCWGTTTTTGSNPGETKLQNLMAGEKQNTPLSQTIIGCVGSHEYIYNEPIKGHFFKIKLEEIFLNLVSKNVVSLNILKINIFLIVCDFYMFF